MRENLEGKLPSLPRGPGVYLFHDEAGDVLYVGKAKSLRSRVRSYFQRGDGRIGAAQLVERIADVEVIVTRTEAEALLLEQNLVKRHRPPFNIRLRDDKSFPYIAITLGDEYPRVMFTRERHRRGTVYFGPYANAKKVRETLDVLNRVFRFRPCEGPRPGRHSGIPCLDFHIDRCLAPCIGAIGQEDYGQIIDGVTAFLSGDTDTIQRQLEERMRDAAAGERFEEAARYRNRLFSIRHLAERQASDKRAVGTVDVIGLAVEADRAAVQVFPLRDGKMIDRYAFHLENVAGDDAQTVLEAFATEYYGSLPSTPPEVLVPTGVADTSAIAGFLTSRRGSRVEVRAPQRGEKRRLVELAVENARLALDSDTAQREATRRRRVAALEELREALNLESLPLRIECFDVSNIQGESIVASMVVFVDGRPKNAHYRTFSIRGLDGQDDVGAMREAIGRRFARLRTQELDESFSRMPNLVVVDGGKGQLAAALAAMEKLDLPRVAVIALAKREEEVFVPGLPVPIGLDRSSPALQLLQRIRDEAHRVALR
ncbi:MAG: excinuclease ABC subunit UvrC, partial [Gaiellaceae bacterium]